MDKIRVLLASNFLLLRDGLRAMLRDANHIAVVGESVTGCETVALARQLRPEILILEITGEEGDMSAHVIQALHHLAPETRIIAVSLVVQNESGLKLLRLGVRGFLSGHETTAELIDAVETVARGQIFLCPAASRVLLSGYRAQARAHKPALHPKHTG